jgi:hypothetical protein
MAQKMVAAIWGRRSIAKRISKRLRRRTAKTQSQEF